MELKNTIMNRKSVRSYTGAPLTDEQMHRILEAANAAPVGMGKYDSVYVTVINNKALLDDIDKNAAEFFKNPDIHPLYGAPTLIVVSSDSEGSIPDANAAIMVHNMALTAVDLGLGHCDIYGATIAMKGNPALVRRLHLPEGFTPIAAIVVGETEEKYEDREIEERIAISVID